MATGKILPSQERKTRKPIIERRRRAKINNYLDEMKTLVLEALNKDVSQFNKMEKADILEMTANYLKSIRCQNTPSTDDIMQYRAGYQDCMTEVSRCLATTPEYHQIQMLNLSQTALRCTAPISPVSSERLSPAIMTSSPCPSIMSTSRPNMNIQFIYPTPPPSPDASFENVKRERFSVKKDKNTELWRPWC